MRRPHCPQIPDCPGGELNMHRAPVSNRRVLGWETVTSEDHSFVSVHLRLVFAGGAGSAVPGSLGNEDLRHRDPGLSMHGINENNAREKRVPQTTCDGGVAHPVAEGRHGS